jgi:N-methylhydantoinase A
VLSGPAGGVVGMSRASREAGFERVIGFDMGGTSTDVAHFDGELERQFETEVAGVRMAAPMLAIHTVAAGGGSVLAFDGARLRVGPRSAGANPGPACYRRGGPLTVTDANLVLGRIDAARFLGGAMPLDAAAAARAIDERLGAPLGLSRVRAAAGVVRLADVKMALAVRSVTTERGLHPRDYALVAYGGGGPLHAVAIARELGIPRVVVPPSPSTFSAWGMLATDLRHDLVRTVLEPIEATDAAWADARYREMQAEIEAILPPVGAPDTRRAADLRYLGQEHTVTVAVGEVRGAADGEPSESGRVPWAELRRRFDAAHERAYGYAAPDVPVQLLNLRLTVVFPLPRPQLTSLPPAGGAVPVYETRKIYSTLLQDLLEYRVLQRDQLRAGDAVEGPAAVEESGTTTVIEPGDALRVEPHGCLMIDVGWVPA